MIVEKIPISQRRRKRADVLEMSITKHAHLEEWTKIMKQETVQGSEDNPESKPQKTMFQEAGCGLKYQSLQRCYGG